MKPVYQTRQNEIDGNCFEAALASLLDLSLDAIPNIGKIEHGESWYSTIEGWLRAMNFYMVSIDMGTSPEFIPEGYHLICGKSGSFDCYHAVVGLKGKMVHNPSGDDAPPLKSFDYFDLLISINPAILIQRSDLERVS